MSVFTEVYKNFQEITKCLVIFLIICSSVVTNAADKLANVMVLDFELKDLTIYENNHAELERTASLKPLLEQALIDVGHTQIVEFDLEEQQQADLGVGYLYDRHNLVAELGEHNDARWVVVGRVHKPSYLFVYLKAQLIDVTNKSMAADLTVEMKGQQEKFIKKSVHRLATQIKEAIDHYSQ